MPPAESTRDHHGVDRSDLDSIRVLGPESTNPHSLLPQKISFRTLPAWEAQRANHGLESGRLRQRPPIKGNGLDFSPANARAIRGPMPVTGLARAGLSTGLRRPQGAGPSQRAHVNAPSRDDGHGPSHLV